jgi:copper chaperone CopZ
MCKELIEEASHSIDGVNYADWNLTSKLITINYDNTITCLDSIHFAISKIGYKTDKLPATKKGYKSLPFCCKVSGACKPLKTK